MESLEWAVVLFQICIGIKMKRIRHAVVLTVCISSNIPASPAHGVNISQLIRFSRACAQYIHFLYRAQLLMQKLRKQGYVAPRLKSLLQNFYGRHHNLVDR
jgi:hypothetical protein